MSERINGEEYPYVRYESHSKVNEDGGNYDGVPTVEFLHEVKVLEGHVCVLPLTKDKEAPGVGSIVKCLCGRYYVSIAEFSCRTWRQISERSAMKRLKKVGK